MNKGSSAFPSEKEDDPLLNMVLPQLEAKAFAEERRLFYVALTRAKEKVFLIGERGSIFMEEIINDPNFKEFIYVPQDESQANQQRYITGMAMSEMWTRSFMEKDRKIWGFYGLQSISRL